MQGSSCVSGLIVLASVAACYARPPAPAASSAIQEISLTRAPGGLGNGPGYSFVLRADGSASYQGRVNVPMLGSYVAELDSQRFRSLAEHAIRIGYWALEPHYTSEYTDQTSAVTSVTAGRRRTEVLNYGGAGPRELREFEWAVDDVGSRLRWRSAPDDD